MSNKYWNKDTAPSKQSGGEGGSNKAQGGPSTLHLPEKTASWPGVPGKTQKSRAGGAPTTGHAGPFYVRKDGL